MAREMVCQNYELLRRIYLCEDISLNLEVDIHEQNYIKHIRTLLEEEGR